MSNTVALFHMADGRTVIAYVDYDGLDGITLHRPCEVVPVRQEHGIELRFVPYLTLGNTLPAVEDLSLQRVHVLHKRPAPKDLEDGYRQAVSGIILT